MNLVIKYIISDDEGENEKKKKCGLHWNPEHDPAMNVTTHSRSVQNAGDQIQNVEIKVREAASISGIESVCLEADSIIRIGSVCLKANFLNNSHFQL